MDVGVSDKLDIYGEAGSTPHSVGRHNNERGTSYM